VAMQNVGHNQWYRLIFYLRWQANDGGQLFATIGDNSAKSQATKTMSDRQSFLEKSLDLLDEQLRGKEIAMILAPPEDKVRIRQQIRDLREEMGEFEAELKQLQAGINWVFWVHGDKHS